MLGRRAADSAARWIRVKGRIANIGRNRSMRPCMSCPGAVELHALHCSAMRRGLGDWMSGVMQEWMNHDKKLVGKDAAGNQFWEISNPGGHPDPRREVEFPSPDPEDFDMETVPTEWRMWLYHNRDDPPTEEEILASQRERDAIYARAMELAQADADTRETELQHHARVSPDAGGAEHASAAGEAKGSGTDSFEVGVFDPTADIDTLKP